jgi:hypothetical protein
MSYTNTVPSQIKSCRIVIALHNSQNQALSATSRLWEPLAYPLFFPSGTLGWGISTVDGDISAHHVNTDNTTTQMWHYRA